MLNTLLQTGYEAGTNTAAFLAQPGALADVRRAGWRYLGGGALTAGGFFLEEVGAQGPTYSGFGARVTPGAETRAQGLKPMVSGRGMNVAMSAVGPAASAYFIYQGYKQNGITGAYDAAAWDIAASSATHHFLLKSATTASVSGGIRTITATKPGSFASVSGGIRTIGMGRMMGYGLAGGIGASIGQAMGEATGLPGASTLGAFAGGFIGAGIPYAIPRHPLAAATVLGAMAATAGVGVAAYGTFEILKAGRNRRRMQKRIDTSGDMAAFHTQGAYTMRARSVQAIAKSHTNARSALGREGALLAKPSINYQSTYRF